MNAIQALYAVRNATQKARERTGDKRICVSVKQGLYRLELVSDNSDGSSNVDPISDRISLSAALLALDAL